MTVITFLVEVIEYQSTEVEVAGVAIVSRGTTSDNEMRLSLIQLRFRNVPVVFDLTWSTSADSGRRRRGYQTSRDRSRLRAVVAH
jgi:hypothetical protein